jgi:peptide/nickel transport system substrate-binding protein
MDYRILGPLEVTDGDRPVLLGGEKQRALLVLLLLHAGEVVSADRLIDDLWGERSPAGALKALQVHISRLRKVLDGDGDVLPDANGDTSTTASGPVVLTRGHGYVLRLEPGELDLDRFQAVVEAGRQALSQGDPVRASQSFRAGLALWRGPPLADFTYEAFAQAPIARLDELRLGAIEDCVDADLALGRHDQLVGELTAMVEQHPLRERLRMQLMLALHRSGRQAEALDVYQEYRRGLAQELGLDPSARMQQLEGAILTRDPSLELPSRTEPAGAGAPVSRARRTGGSRRRLALGGLVLVAATVAAVLAVVSLGGGAAPLSVIAAGSVGAISQSSGAITADAPVGSSPSGVAAGGGSLWVADYSDSTVSGIDPATHAVDETIPGVSTPLGIAFGFRAVWVANNFGATVSRIDPAVDSVQPIHVGSGPTGVAVGADSVWVTNSSDGTLSRIDPVTDAVKTIRLGGGATDVAVGDGAVWVSDAADGRVLRVDPPTDTVTAINVGNGPTAITVGFRSVWVTNSLDGTVSRIDPRTNKVKALFAVGDGPNAIVAGAGGVWVANEFSGSVVLINAATNTVVRTVAVGNSPRGLAIAGGLVWISAQASAKSIPTSGPGLTQPTSPTGTKMSGGTVYFTDAYGAPPSYIFPMYSAAACNVNNVTQFMNMMYRPLYWYGNNYRSTVDYSYSIGQPPTFSDGNRTVTIRLNSWKWSDGESVTSRDLVFWMNVLKANPSAEWCGYAPGYFPDLVKSYSAPNPTTFVLHLNKAYNPEWVLYNELSQLTPIPLAWDRTSLSQPAPTAANGHLPDTTKAGPTAVYRFLDAQGKNTAGWASSPLWRVVDGPFRLQSFTRTGEVTLVPNPSYSGWPKPTISKLIELPSTSDAASFRVVRSGGPSAVTIANIPSQYAGAIPTLTAEGYDLNRAAKYAFTYFPLNFNSSATTSPGGEKVRYIFRQAYFRQALQHLVDQQGWITAFFLGTADPTCGPIPLSPPSPLVNAAAVSARPCAFSTAAARQLLSANGWNVVPAGTTTCVKPGAAASECGAGIKAGEGISFNVDYLSGVASVRDEMDDLAAQARRVGINLSLTADSFTRVIGAAVACTPNQSACKWTAQNWAGSWIYGPAFLPTGEQLYGRGAFANAGSYTDAKMTRLVQATITGPASQEAHALAVYSQYIQRQLPVVFEPTKIGTYADDAGTLIAKNLGGYAANALGLMNPENWYFTR